MLKVCMNMRNLCLMNADKTDISNTNRPRNQTPGTILPEEKPNWRANLPKIHMLKSKDLRVLQGKKRYQDTPNL